MDKTEKNLEAMIIDRILVENNRPTILPKPMPMYERDSSEYPEMIRVSFSDGSTAVYELRVEQPAPVIIENIKIIRKWKQGYVNQPMWRRNRT